MANGLQVVPDWFGWENQGAGIAVADLDGDGHDDLVVLAVDNPAGQNSGVYRVGHRIDATGMATGGWGPWQVVPDWFGWENQGAGIAVADLSGTGGHDLLVFVVDNPAGQNSGVYRVGHRIDATGMVTGGWGPWQVVPDWFGWENQAGAATVADVDGDGHLDLVVFTIDNPSGLNAGLYRVGHRLDADGAVTGGWGPWQQVPDWFSWENQGGGIALADVDGNGSLDLIVFQIDNPPGPNQAYYKIGRQVGPDGAVAPGNWSTWFGVPDWFSWENQGGAVAARMVDGRPQIIVLGVDNPAGQNSGFYEVIDLTDDPATRGRWELLPYHSGVLAVHAAVLRTSKVLFAAGTGNNLVRAHSPDFGDVAKGIYTSVVWNPADGSFDHPATIRDAQGHPFDLFCGGETFLADGTVLCAGGTAAYDEGHPFLGRADAVGFDPVAEQWGKRAAMASGRWYPTLTALGDGRVLAVSGLDGTGAPNLTVEAYHPDTDGWQELPMPPAQQFGGLPTYAHMVLLGNGTVFFSGGRMDDARPTAPCVLDLSTTPVTMTAVPGLPDPATRNQSASVLLPPAQQQRVMIIGGGPQDETDATASTAVADLSAPNPQYRPAAPMGLPRMHLNAVLLPDHTVLVSGGATRREFGIAPRLEAEIYDPATDTWRPAARASVARMYHSVALLLPDGRVATAGGNPMRGTQVAWEPPDPHEEMRLEIYYPPYLFAGPRPIISDVSLQWTYGQTVTIHYQSANTIRWVSIIRPGATTHAFDNSQRLGDLDIHSQDSGTIQAALTDNPNIAPPGWYMLFLVDTSGVPSVATWVHVSS